MRGFPFLTLKTKPFLFHILALSHQIHSWKMPEIYSCAYSNLSQHIWILKHGSTNNVSVHKCCSLFYHWLFITRNQKIIRINIGRLYGRMSHMTAMITWIFTIRPCSHQNLCTMASLRTWLSLLYWSSTSCDGEILIWWTKRNYFPPLHFSSLTTTMAQQQIWQVDSRTYPGCI